MEKIIKPTTCEKCVVCHTEKNKLVCRVCKLEADKNDTREKLKMWYSCKLDWDE